MEKQKKSLSTSLWVGSTYFMEGFPFILVRSISSVYFTDMGVREALLGFLNFLGIPWNLKFIWAPFLDIFSTKRAWMIKIQTAIMLILFAIAFMAGLYDQTASPSMLKAIAFMFVALAFVSATNDVAIDAYYLEGLTDKEDQAAYSGWRIMTYRLAVIFARSVLVAIAGLANWFYGFGIGAIVVLLFVVGHRLFLPRFEAERTGPKKAPSQILQEFKDSFSSYLGQKGIVLSLFFVIFYKLGDEILFSMNTPFLMRELGVTKIQLSWLAGIVGMVATIIGGLLGAYWVKRVGLKKAIWPITLIMNINIWAYVLLAYLKPSAADTNGMILIAIIHAYEYLAAGLGNIVLMIYLMRLCNPQFKAAHYAFGSAIISLGATFIGGFGGVIVEFMGYMNLFIMAFAAAVPSIIMLFWLPLHEK